MKLKQANLLLLSAALCIFSCSKNKVNPQKNTQTDTTAKQGTHLLFDADQDYNTGKTKSPSLFTSLYYSNLDGSKITRLTTPPDKYFDYEASASYDGKTILFIRNNEDDDDRSLCSINVDGSNFRTLVKGDHVDFGSLSPDGSKIVYEKSPGNSPYTYSMYVSNADGTNETDILPSVNGSNIVAIYWGVDGKIYFNGTTATDTINTLYSINPDGSNLTPIVPSAFLINVSHTNTHLFYEKNDGVYTSLINGNNPIRILPPNTYDDYVLGGGWSTDEKKVCYSDVNSTASLSGIYIINADGTGKTMILNGYYEYPSIF